MIMPKGKHQKINSSNKPPHRKKRGRETDVSELRAELDVLGLKIIQVTPDGNCFFRALADQLEGDEDKHDKYRNMVVRFMKNNREMFEPFVEDEVPFEEYCRSMAQEGNWAGHVELQAASLATHSNICIHRHRSPRWHAHNFDAHEAPQIHLSYHDGEHYNSVRLKEDTCSGPARPIFIEDNTGHSSKSNKEDVVCSVPEKEGGETFLQEKSSNILNAGRLCEDSTKAPQALNCGDIVAEVPTAEQESGDHMCAGFLDGHQDMNCGKHELREALEHDISTNDVDRVCSMNSPRANEKRNFKNKASLNGSKRKYKSCCISVTGKSSGRLPVNRTDEHGKSSRNRKPSQKGATSVVNTVRSNKRSPDWGGSLSP